MWTDQIHCLSLCIYEFQGGGAGARLATRLKLNFNVEIWLNLLRVTTHKVDEKLIFKSSVKEVYATDDIWRRNKIR